MTCLRAEETNVIKLPGILHLNQPQKREAENMKQVIFDILAIQKELAQFIMEKRRKNAGTVKTPTTNQKVIFSTRIDRKIIQ